jgi:hypothetical protein
MFLREAMNLNTKLRKILNGGHLRNIDVTDLALFILNINQGKCFGGSAVICLKTNKTTFGI